MSKLDQAAARLNKALEKASTPSRDGNPTRFQLMLVAIPDDARLDDPDLRSVWYPDKPVARRLRVTEINELAAFLEGRYS